MRSRSPLRCLQGCLARPPDLTASRWSPTAAPADSPAPRPATRGQSWLPQRGCPGSHKPSTSRPAPPWTPPRHFGSESGPGPPSPPPSPRTCCTSWPPLTRPSPNRGPPPHAGAGGTRTAGLVQPSSRPIPLSDALDATGCPSPTPRQVQRCRSTDPLVLSTNTIVSPHGRERAQPPYATPRATAPLPTVSALAAAAEVSRGTAATVLEPLRGHPAKRRASRLVRSIGSSSGRRAARAEVRSARIGIALLRCSAAMRSIAAS
jgi:hypothetical protein